MFQIVEPDHPLRPEVEAAIRFAYHRDHGAHLNDFPHWLVAMTDGGGVVGAASLRFASDGFFSECYLDQPLEQAVARMGDGGGRSERHLLAEVGNLAATRPGEVRSLIGGIVRLLRDLGMDWAVFTATARLRALLRHGGMPLIELGRADPARLPNADVWGRYYRQDPRVMLIGAHMLPDTGPMCSALPPPRALSLFPAFPSIASFPPTSPFPQASILARTRHDDFIL